MSIGSLFKKLWGHPLAVHAEVDDAKAVECHRRILESKPLLRRQYMKWYRECLVAFEETRHLTGPLVEVGSGGGFLDRVIPNLLKTDVASNPFVDRVMDATKLDFSDNEVRAIFLISVLHHIPKPGEFLREAQRCLKVGGRLVMVEPHNSFIQRFLCKYLDHYEYFDDTIREWENVFSGRMTHANLALPWVIFVRDEDRFHREFPQLRIKRIKYTTFLSLVITGGMSYRAFVPSFCWPLLDLIEWLATPFMKVLGTIMVIDIEKIPEATR